MRIQVRTVYILLHKLLLHPRSKNADALSYVLYTASKKCFWSLLYDVQGAAIVLSPLYNKAL